MAQLKSVELTDHGVLLGRLTPNPTGVVIEIFVDFDHAEAVATGLIQEARRP